MKLGEMLDRLDGPIDPSVNSDSLIEELGLSGWVDLDQHGFTSRTITVWICTDTWVGRRAVYLDGELVAITNQECRKCSTDWEWTSDAAYDRVYAAVRDALRTVEGPRNLSIIDRDAEIGEPLYQLNWAGEVLWHGPHRTGIYQGRTVTILGAGNRDYLCDSVKIDDAGEERVAPLSEIRFRVPLR